jgi:hypothetical protein
MTKRRVLFLATAVVAIVLAGIPAVVDWQAGAEQLPVRLTDQEFWKIVSESSEPGGTFHSENLVSNEIRFQSIVPELMRIAFPGRAYIGVGSEQNFTYIAAIRPIIAFIVDIRRGNLDLHLIYKVLFELSADRAEFVSKLFSREKPGGLSNASTAAELFAAYRKAAPSQSLYNQNLKTIKTTLTTKHGFQLSDGDLKAIDFIYSAWFRYGPDLRYELTGGGGGPNFPTYAALMTTADAGGKNRSYLATEEAFRVVKDLQARNMIIPVVGNFAGPKALRAIGAYLKQKETLVSTFYTSNVEQYLRQDGIWGNFCGSVATMPIDAKSVFLRSARAGFAGQPTVVGAGDNFILQVNPMQADLNRCAAVR